MQTPKLYPPPILQNGKETKPTYQLVLVILTFNVQNSQQILANIYLVFSNPPNYSMEVYEPHPNSAE